MKAGLMNFKSAFFNKNILIIWAPPTMRWDWAFATRFFAMPIM